MASAGSTAATAGYAAMRTSRSSTLSRHRPVLDVEVEAQGADPPHSAGSNSVRLGLCLLTPRASARSRAKKRFDLVEVVRIASRLGYQFSIDVPAPRADRIRCPLVIQQQHRR